MRGHPWEGMNEGFKNEQGINAGVQNERAWMEEKANEQTNERA